VPDVTHIHPILSIVLVMAVLGVGAYAAAVMKRAFGTGPGGLQWTAAFLSPIREGHILLKQAPNSTERPDMMLWAAAPAAYAAIAACAFTVVPVADRLAVADVRTGIVLFGAAEALAIVALYLHGWSPNSHLALLGGYRFVALGLSYELLSMFVLIAAALPAESLQVSAIVESQAHIWNVIRQPLGLPLWIIVTLGVTFTGPLNLVDGNDLARGGAGEISGRHLLLWRASRKAMLTVFCAMGASVFLGGWHGPILPGWAWILVKTLLLMALISWVGNRLARVPAERAVVYLWTIGLPVSFIHLLLAGIEALL
jgi:NADH-quinone oxidoreductase subunit H